MNKLLIRLIVFFVYKIDWKKLLLVGAIILTLGLILQITLLPFPLSTWLHSPLLYISTPKSSSAPIQLSLQHGKYWSLHQIAMPAPLNASSELTKNVRASRRKRRRNREYELQVPPPPPTPPTPLQVYFGFNVS